MRTLRYFIAGAMIIAVIAGCSGRNSETRIRQSQSLLRQGQHETAKAELEDLAHANPHDPQIQFLLGQTNLALGNYSEAIVAFESAEKYGITQTAEFFLRKGIAQYHAGTIGKAESSIEASIGIQPSGEAYRYLGLVRSQHADYTGATEAFQRASGLDDDITALTAYGTSLYHTGQNSEALDVLARVLSLKPNDETIIYMIANAYLMNNRYRDAISHYNQINETSRHYSDALYNQGEAYMSLDEIDRAISTFRAYLKREPDDRAAQFNLATSLIQSQNYSDAEELLTDLLNDTAYRVRAEYNLGISYYYSGNTEDAIRSLSQAVRHDPDNLRYRYAMALALTDFGDISSAREQIQEILARDPANTDALAWQSHHPYGK